jgi:hypothetical protein
MNTQITPAFQILNVSHTASDEVQLWRAADDLIEYHMHLAGETDSHYAIQQACSFIQLAAVAAQNGNNVAELDNLNKAAAVKGIDDDVRFDIYRLIYSLGFECPAHGDETFTETKGGWHFDGEPWDDITAHELCSFCGENAEYSRCKYLTASE